MNKKYRLTFTIDKGYNMGDYLQELNKDFRAMYFQYDLPLNNKKQKFVKEYSFIHDGYEYFLGLSTNKKHLDDLEKNGSIFVFDKLIGFKKTTKKEFARCKYTLINDNNDTKS